MDPALIKTIQDSWALAESVGFQTVGILLFKRIFELAPSALELFPFKDEPDMENSKMFKKHALIVVQAVDKAVKNLTDLGVVIPLLSRMGKKHVSYGVVPAHYDVVGQALIDTLAAGLGDAFTDDVKEAWVALYGVVKTTMIGDHYDEPTEVTKPAEKGKMQRSYI
eukprot:m.30619 g.30619  ORF g.30619 m.30619 type:complete len:166 (+) comp9654_c0_seq1:116-613(+)